MKRQEANVKIAQILVKRLSDQDALELAGRSLLIMKHFEAAEEAFRKRVALRPPTPILSVQKTLIFRIY
jgi:hypothetical protein